jgi:signal transduction histidine kinase
MITDMLAFARLGAQLPEPEEVDLAQEVAVVAGEVTETYHRPLKVEVHDLPHVRVDRGLFRLVLTNVLGNAAKYVPSDRPARVVVDAVPRGEGELVVIRFADNGDGIPAADRDRLMRMFERGSNDHDVSGTGIGLSICGRVAEVHGGRFWIEDAPGGGARFCLALPARA